MRKFRNLSIGVFLNQGFAVKSYNERMPEANALLWRKQIRVVLDEVRGARFELGQIDRLRQIRETMERVWTSRIGSWPDDVEYMETEIQYLLCVCLLSEIQDHFGLYSPAYQVILQSGELCYDSFATISGPLNRTAKKLLRQRCWTTSFYANARYRRGELRRSEDILLRSLEVLDQWLPIRRELGMADGETTFGVRARIAYSLGRNYLLLHQFPDARQRFTEAITNQQARLDRKLRLNEEPAIEKVFATYFAGKCFAFGLGQVSIDAGELQRAMASVSLGRTLMETTDDTVHQAYAKILFTQIVRRSARRRSGQEEMLDAEKMLLEVDQSGVFDNQPRFQFRLQLELSKVMLAAGNVDGAAVRVDKIRKIESLTKNQRLQAEVQASRIERARGDFDEAFRLANEAVKKAGENEVGAKAAGLIAEGEALRMRAEKTGNDEAARQDYLSRASESFEAAHKLDKKNVQNRLACDLHLAYCAALARDSAKFHEHKEKWETFKRHHSPEDGFIQDLAQDVVEAGEKMLADFVLPTGTPITYEEAHAQLRGWLSYTAMEHTQDVDEAAKQLGVSRQTIYNWKQLKSAKPVADEEVES